VRGLALLALAVLIGVVLLNATDADPPGTTVTANGDSDSGDDPSGDQPAAASTTTVPPTTTAPPRAPKDVKVIIANASDVKGAAAGASNTLKPPGYNVLAPANAAAVKDSSVFFTPGYDRDAAAVAAALVMPATAVKPLPAPAPFDTKGANIAVVLGSDHAARFAAPGATTTTAAAAGATTTTTARTGATTTTAAVTTTTKR
jgi:hypothetical protein